MVANPSVTPGEVQEKTSVQLLHQEDDLPSGSTPSVPPPVAPEGTQPLHGGWPRSSLCNPMQLATKFHSARWKKDLEHVLRVYYKYNAASFKEAEWVRLKMFFMYFFPHKEETLGIKERCPINYMACIEEHFYRATGLHLNGLRGFTAWIKQGSYYHRLVAQQGCLHECPHLAGLPLPRQPQVTPSESHQESQMKAEAMATSSSKPSAGAMVALSQRLLLWRLLSQRLQVRKLLLLPVTHQLPWRQAEQVMANHGPNASRLVWRRNFKRIGP